ncbi:TPA: hypothetical protein ACTZ2U_005349 [Bacillus cereus]
MKDRFKDEKVVLISEFRNEVLGDLDRFIKLRDEYSLGRFQNPDPKEEVRNSLFLIRLESIIKDALFEGRDSLFIEDIIDNLEIMNKYVDRHKIYGSKLNKED